MNGPSKVCRHAKNEKLFAFHGCKSIVIQVTHDMARENAKKVVQFATVLHLLQQGHPMLEYEALMPLFKFLRVEKQQETLE
jgi:hypothetical protein